MARSRPIWIKATLSIIGSDSNIFPVVCFSRESIRIETKYAMILEPVSALSLLFVLAPKAGYSQISIRLAKTTENAKMAVCIVLQCPRYFLMHL